MASVIDCHQKLGCYLSVLSDIKNNYESIFSWDIYEKTKICRDKKTVVFEKVTRKLENSFDSKNVFDLNDFCLRLINCFEIFLNGDFSEAKCVIESLIETLNNTAINEFFKSISDVCFHILKATQAYIMAFLDEDVQKVLKSIKPSYTFNTIETAAIYAIKSKIFMEYPPGGNNIALDLAKTTRILNGTEIYWTSIWLKAQGRKRKSRNKCSLAFSEEFELANKMSNDNNPEILLCAAKFFLEAGFAFGSLGKNQGQSLLYYRNIINLAKKAYMLAPDNLKIICHFLIILTDIPNQLLLCSMDFIKEMAKNIPRETQNNKINEALGKYFLFISKDYKEAKKHLIKASSNKMFSSSMYMLMIDESADSNFSVVSYLNSLLEIYDTPKKRLIIISQILLYLVWVCKVDQDSQLLHYLNIYLNEDINKAYKKYYIYHVRPFFMLYVLPKNIKLFDNLKAKIDSFQTYQDWSSKNWITLGLVVSKFFTICDQYRTEEYDIMDMTCVICLEEGKACFVFEPCHHKCVCEVCWSVLSMDNDKLCPLCRSSVISASKF